MSCMWKEGRKPPTVHPGLWRARAPAQPGPGPRKGRCPGAPAALPPTCWGPGRPPPANLSPGWHRSLSNRHATFSPLMGDPIDASMGSSHLELIQAHHTTQSTAKQVPRDTHAQWYKWSQLLHKPHEGTGAVVQTNLSCYVIIYKMWSKKAWTGHLG